MILFCIVNKPTKFPPWAGCKELLISVTKQKHYSGCFNVLVQMSGADCGLT